MGYYQDLQNLLAPLGIYAEGGLSDAELFALASALDATESALQTVLQEMLPFSAQGEGLARWENILPLIPFPRSTTERQSALVAWLCIQEWALTPLALSQTLGGCGYPVTLQELGVGRVEVSFPHIGGVPENFSLLQKNLLAILPAHLQVSFHFFYQTWAMCLSRQTSWRSLEASQITWNIFEKMISSDT